MATTTAKQNLEDARARLARIERTRCGGYCASCNAEYTEMAEQLKSAELDYYKSEAVRFANGIRFFLGLEPIEELSPGDVSDPNSCTISATINRETGLFADTKYDKVVVERDNGLGYRQTVFTAPVPEDVAVFLRKFDRGLYPELVLANNNMRLS